MLRGWGESRLYQIVGESLKVRQSDLEQWLIVHKRE